MKRLLNNFVNDMCVDNGLFLLPLPTGFGKSRQIIRFIFEQKDKKIFYISSLLKNIDHPFNDLKNLFKESGKEDEFKESSICLKENGEYLLDNFTQVYNSIPKDIKKEKYFKEINRIFNKYNLFDKNQDRMQINKKEIIDELKEYERAFRKDISNKYFNKNIDKQTKIKLVESSEFEWLRKLYPSVLSYKKRIIFMSVSKFYYGNSTIIEPTTPCYDSDEIKNSIIIIDEIDESKKTFLNHIFDDALHEPDILEIAKRIFITITNKTMPIKLEKDSLLNLERIKKNPKYKTAKEMLERIKASFCELNNKHKIEYNFKYEQNNEAKDEFMFNDVFSMRPITLGDDEMILYNYDSQERINNITVRKKQRNEKYDNSFTSFLGDVLNCFNTFAFWSEKLALNYMELKNENSEFKISPDDALKSIFDEFGLDNSAKKYFLDKNNFKENNSNYIWDEFYSNAFRILKISNGLEHDLKSKILISDYYKTPEIILEKMAKKALVIGLSATADIDSTFSNYNLELLKQNLGDNFYSLYDKSFECDLNRLKAEFQERLKGYEDIDIQAIKLEAKVDYNDIYKQELIQAFKKEFSKNQDDKKENNFYLDRFYKLDSAISQFAKDNELKSMLCFTNKKYTDEISQICLKELEKHQITIMVLTSQNFKSTMDEIKTCLSQGKKICVITSYYTASVGQNMQYQIPENIKTIKVGTWDGGNEKDFDALYLENISNISINTNDEDLEYNNKYKAIYHAKSLRLRGEITKKAFNERLQNIFNPKKYIKLKNVTSYFGAVAARYIQAIGRLSRTNQKNPKIRIFFDEEIKIDPTLIDTRLKTPEFLTFLSMVQTTKSSYTDRQEEENLDRCECSRKLLDMLLGSLRKGNKDEWKEKRNIVLKSPTIDENRYKDFKNTNDAFLFVELKEPASSYFYSKEGDFEKITRIIQGNNEVSAKDARLDIIMKIPGLKEHFKINGYATSFEKNPYILTPIFFNNVYKGALGEVVIKYIFKTELEIELQTLDDTDDFFEFFDFKFGDIYIDAKNWNEITSSFNKEAREKTLNKLEKIGGKKAIIVNVFSSNKYQTYCDKKICVVSRLFDGTKIDKERLTAIRDFINDN